MKQLNVTGMFQKFKNQPQLYHFKLLQWIYDKISAEEPSFYTTFFRLSKFFFTRSLCMLSTARLDKDQGSWTKLRLTVEKERSASTLITGV